MAAALKTATLVGTIGASGAKTTTGPSLKMGCYTASKVAQSDWVILDDFTVVLYADAVTVSTGAYTSETVTVDATTTNKVVFTSATAGVTVNLFVIGY
jgi:hypothetical protein